MKILFNLLLFLFASALQAQNKDGFCLEMFGAGTSPINAFASQSDYQAVADWTELPFEAGIGFSYRQNAGDNQQWGLKLGLSRLAFGYAGSELIDFNSQGQELRPISTRRIYAQFAPLYSFALIDRASFLFELENSFSVKIPLNAYSLTRDAAKNNVEVDELKTLSINRLSVFQLSVAPTFVWGSARLGFPLSYNMSSGQNWEILSGWSAGLSLSYFVDE